ncbi:MAG: thioredoxin domain-containing protein [Parcubacteria group bacterium]|nr:thioredoxin domain-containing protein [Parcubacteria group bacterium]
MDEVSTSVSQGEQGTPSSRPTQSVNSNIVIAAVILAVGLIAAAVIFKGDSSGDTTGSPDERRTTLEDFRPVAAGDHIRGDPNAKVTVIEYSDLECPFCKQFHPTMQQLVAEYDGKVRWVYRHWPITSRHPKATKEAEASECAAEQGKFWEYIDRVFEITPANNGLDLEQLPVIAQEVGLDVASFEACLESGKYQERIQNDADEAIRIGGTGTPFSVIVDAEGKATPFSGAQPYENLKTVIDPLVN